MTLLTRLEVPVFSAGGMPELPDGSWRLDVGGLVERPQSFGLAQMRHMPQSEVDARLTSVSGFSVRARWQGVLWRDFWQRLEPLPAASHATFISYGGGYTTCVALSDLDHPRVLLCLAVDGEPLEREYGGPLRMMIPPLYGYKSAKWLARVELTDAMAGGYWEDRGYSRSGIIEPGHTMDLNTRTRRPIAGGEVTEF